MYEKRSFDAEAIFLQLKRDVFVWYDTDNDGAFDVLLYDKRANGKVDSAYRIDSSGKLTVDEALKAGKPFRSALFPNAELGSRFGKMTRTAFPPHFSDGEAARGDSLPPPISLAGRARRKDLTATANQTLWTSGVPTAGVLVDGDVISPAR